MSEPAWTCTPTAPGAAADPAALALLPLDWLPATVPGTAASALLQAGRLPVEDQDLLDGHDWWFRAEVAGSGAYVLALQGLATLADVWLDDRHLLRSQDMYLSHRVEVTLGGSHTLAIRCAALDPVLAGRHPRPRWKSRLVRSQALRWHRASLLGRTPSWSSRAAPVGPWRPVTLTPLPALELLDHRLVARCVGAGGVVDVAVTTGVQPTTATLRVGEVSGPLQVTADGAQGSLTLPAADRWWPAGYGAQPLYDTAVVIDGVELPLGRVGFREVTVDRTDGAFTIRVNGVPVFCRGVLWNQPDTVGFTPADVRADLVRARSMGSTMIRVAGWSTYQDQTFWDACDELGILVWQDAMIASVDPPETAAFAATMTTEVRGVLRPLQGRPSLAVFCGSAESHQQAAMLGLGAAVIENALLDETIPAVVEDLVPGLPYLPSSPSGGQPPFTPVEGVCHYFGVGAYLRPLSDGRTAGVRFASECLGFGIPPERESVEEWFGGAAVAGHDPRWKAGVGRDGGASWDFEDVTNHYVREIFGVDPFEVRYADPELALDYARAAVAEAMTTVLTDWRRAGDPCDGGLVLTWRDAWPGAGWGLHDAAGRPKAPARALARVLAPDALWFSGDGLAGLSLHLAHDGPAPLSSSLRLSLHDDLGQVVEAVERAVEVPARGQLRLAVAELFDGFRDLTRAYRFSPAAVDVVLAELDGVGSAVHLPAGPERPRLPSVGLSAVASEGADGWHLTVGSALFAQWVSLYLPGVTAADSWFHLAPGGSRTVALSGRPSRGSVRALNATHGVTVTYA